MKTEIKAIIKRGLLGGIGYASILAGFDFAGGEIFNIQKFILNLFIFGIFMLLLLRYNLKKSKKK